MISSHEVIGRVTPQEVSPLGHFLQAQDADYAQALVELQAWRKQTDWVSSVLRQLRALGRGPMTCDYGISSREEAIADLATRSCAHGSLNASTPCGVTRTEVPRTS